MIVVVDRGGFGWNKESILFYANFYSVLPKQQSTKLQLVWTRFLVSSATGKKQTLAGPRWGNSANHCAVLCRFERHCPTIVSLLIFKIKDQPLITSVLFLSTVKINSATNTSHPFIPRAAGERTRKEETKRLSVQSRGRGAIHIQRGIIWGHFLNKVLMQRPITLCISSPVHFHLGLKIIKKKRLSFIRRRRQDKRSKTKYATCDGSC